MKLFVVMILITKNKMVAVVVAKARIFTIVAMSDSEIVR